MKPIEGHPNLVRSSSGAIVNINTSALTKAKKRRRAEQEKDRKIRDLEERVQRLEEHIKLGSNA